MQTSTRIRIAGFTFIEVAISLVIFAILMTSVFSLARETSSFVLDNDADVTVQNEGNRAYDRLLSILRKSGRVTTAGVTYPRVVGGGSQLEFRQLQDLDGNGYTFDQATGELEWDPLVHTIAADASGDFQVLRGGTPVYLLARRIQNVQFQTISENPALHLREIQISLQARKPTNKGFDMVHTVNASVHMRN